VYTWNIWISAPLRDNNENTRPIWVFPTTSLTPRSRPMSLSHPYHTTPTLLPLPLCSTHYSILLFLPTVAVLSTRSSWSRLIRFFKPKSPLRLSLPTLAFSSQWDVDFIVARRNRFIQKFARTPSASWPAIILLFTDPDGFATVNEQMYYLPCDRCCFLFFLFPTFFIFLSHSTSMCTLCSSFSSLHLSITYS